jgi:hypothetical protein
MMINQVYSPLVQAAPRAGIAMCEVQKPLSAERSNLQSLFRYLFHLFSPDSKFLLNTCARSINSNSNPNDFVNPRPHRLLSILVPVPVPVLFHLP